jgi:hypothetical protein
LHKGTILKKCSLNDCTDLCFSEFKWFPEQFEAARYICIPFSFKMLQTHHHTPMHFNWLF